MIAREGLSDLIGAIYDCALDPNRWQGTIARITQAVDASLGFIVLHDFANNLGSRFFDYGFSEAALRSYFETYAAVNPIAPVAERREVGTVDTLATMFDDDRWEMSAFNREWLRPQGLQDVLGMLVLRTERRGAWLGALRAEVRGAYGEAQVELFRLLSPHVCRAMRISDALDLRSVASDRLAETLDALSTPVFLLAASARVVHRNEAAERMIEAGRTLRVVRSRLSAVHAAAQGRLAAAIARAVAGEHEPTAAHGVPLGNGQLGERAIATLLPLGRPRDDRVFRPWAAAAAIFVQDPDAAAPVPPDAFAELYGLTPAELRFLQAMAGAASVAQASAALGISEATGRSHLQSIFAKTGASRQADLVRLIMTSTMPMQR